MSDREEAIARALHNELSDPNGREPDWAALDYLQQQKWLTSGRAIIAADPVKDQRAEIDRLRLSVATIIREVLDSPTYIDPTINCRNLTRALQEIEGVVAAPSVAAST